MNNFIKQIIIDTPQGEETLHIDVSPPNPNSITLISGKNRTGKTHILEQLVHSIEEHNKNLQKKSNITPKKSHVHSILSNDKRLKVFSILDIKNAKKFLEKIPYSIATRSKRSLEYNLKFIVLEFLEDNLTDILLKDFNNTTFNKDKWKEDENYKYNIFDKFYKNKYSIYPLNPSCKLVKYFENIIGGQLCIGSDNMDSKNVKNVKNLSLYIKYSNSHSYSFADWSEGQKVLLIMLLINYYGDFDLLLIDELENNLHPEFMSKILEKLKENIPQVIITSHNPHLIFSKFIESVVYIEIINEIQTSRQPSTIPNDTTKSFPKKSFPSFKRKIINLDKDIDKMAKTYLLFDNFDKGLLDLSTQAYMEVNEELVEMMQSLFSYDAINEAERKTSDAQSSRMGKILLEIKKDNMKILDYGAGKGRTYFEIKKDNIPTKLENHTYYFWESFEENRNILKEKIANENIKNVEVIENVNNVSKDYYDVIFLTNVIHECNPNDFSKIIKHCNYALKDDGHMIIIELDPLLKSEKFAVSYSQEELTNLLDKTGWKVTNEYHHLLRSKTNAYWLISKKRLNKKLKIKKIKDEILSQWKIIEEKNARNYESRESIDSISEFNKTLSSLTILTSIVSFKNKRWEDLQNDTFFDSLD